MDLVKKKPTGKVVKAMPELNEDFSQKVVQFSVEEKKKARPRPEYSAPRISSPRRSDRTAERRQR